MRRPRRAGADLAAAPVIGAAAFRIGRAGRGRQFRHTLNDLFATAIPQELHDTNQIIAHHLAVVGVTGSLQNTFVTIVETPGTRRSPVRPRFDTGITGIIGIVVIVRIVGIIGTVASGIVCRTTRTESVDGLGTAHTK
jgi:hypothetical protein